MGHQTWSQQTDLHIHIDHQIRIVPNTGIQRSRIRFPTRHLQSRCVRMVTNNKISLARSPNHHHIYPLLPNFYRSLPEYSIVSYQYNVFEFRRFTQTLFSHFGYRQELVFWTEESSVNLNGAHHIGSSQALLQADPFIHSEKQLLQASFNISSAWCRCRTICFSTTHSIATTHLILSINARFTSCYRKEVVWSFLGNCLAQKQLRGSEPIKMFIFLPDILKLSSALFEFFQHLCSILFELTDRSDTYRRNQA